LGFLCAMSSILTRTTSFKPFCRLKFPAADLRWVVLLAFVLLLLPSDLSANESYVLKKGETLYRISKKFDVPVRVLQQYNGIANPQSLPEGARILIPTRYAVEKGDTLYSISRKYSVDLDELMSFNGIGDSTSLAVGRILFVPRKDGGASDEAGSPDSGNPIAPTQPSQHWITSTDTLWPLPGKRENLSGRITGTVIYGSTGDTVVSVSTGRVVWAGPYRGFSRVILIAGKNGYTYVYAGNEETLVTVGDAVQPGAEIGRLGKNVHQGIPQLYFLVYRDGKPVDPSLAPRT